MSTGDNEVYAASCNPPRRARRPLTTEAMANPPSADEPRPPVPIRPYAPRSATHQTELSSPSPPPPPAKRGRKPGPLSRSAREAQRRLNHSIIEKARRTKINDALATLKQLVPADYGRPDPAPADDDEDDEDEEAQGEAKSKPKAKPTKREEKEKEFKLEILVRTVTFLQDLLKRVETLEKQPSTCANCAPSEAKSSARKRTLPDEEDDGLADARPTKRLAAASSSPSIEDAPPTPNAPPPTSFQKTGRLPSISTWLSQPMPDPIPSTGPRRVSTRSPVSPNSCLPTPPSSTRFDPVRPAQYPPTLNLGPVVSLVGSDAQSSHTSRWANDDEHAAATLLLRMSTSPPFRPIASTANVSSYGLSEPSHFRLQSDVRTTSKPEHPTGEAVTHRIQTPGSLLGLDRPAKAR